MKSFIAIFVLIALVQCSAAISLQSMNGLHTLVTSGKQPFDEVKNSSLIVTMSPKKNEINTIEVGTNNIKPGYYYIRYFPYLEFYPLENFSKIDVLFKANSTQTGEDKYIYLKSIRLTTKNKTSHAYVSKTFYPEDPSRKIYSNERIVMKASN